ncbi:MAG: two-component regulator propeller domain-containing protein [Bacteroidota bacterium]
MLNVVCKIVLLWLVFLYWGTTPLVAKNILYDDTKGLSHNFVTHTLKDKTGLLWVSTREGLNTFDGYNFTEIPELKNKYINTLLYDSVHNRLWVGSTTGLFLVNLTTKKVTDCTAKVTSKNITALSIFDRHLFVVFANGLVLDIAPDFATKTVFASSRTYWSVIGNAYSRVAFDNRGYLYVVMHNKPELLVIDLIHRTSFTSKTFSKTGIWSIYNGDGYCILNLDNHKVALYAFDPQSPVVKVIDLPGDIVHETIRLISEYKHEFYFALRENYDWYSLDSTGTHFRHVYSKKNDELFKAWTISSLFHDGDDIVWIGTNKGLIKSYHYQNYPFNHIFGSEGKTVSTRQIVEGRKNELFIASYDGTYQYNLETQTATLLSPVNMPSQFPMYARSLYYDQKKYVYTGSESNAYFFYRYNVQDKKFETHFFKLLTGGIKITTAYCLFPDHTTGLLWIGTDRGLATYNPVDKTVTLHYNDQFSIGLGKIMYMCKAEQNGQFWAVGEDGIFLVDAGKGKIAAYNHSILRTIPDDDFIFAGLSPEKDLWVGSEKSGIVILRKDLQQVSVLNRSRGIPGNNVYSVLWDKNNVAWISTSNGLCRYDRTHDHIHNFVTENGLTDNEFNQNSMLMSRDSTFYFGGINGINYFKPENIVLKNNPFRLFTSGISKWSNGNLIPVEVSANHTIVLNPDDHLLSFNIGIGDYTETENNSYYYKISESKSDWLPLGNSNKLRIDGLSAGMHQIEIIGFNKYGERSQNILTYTIDIKQVFYKTIAFYIVLILLIIVIAFMAFQWTLRNINQKQKLRTQIASNLHDEVGSLLTSIIISTDSARYASSTIEEKNSKLEKISGLSRAATNTMSDVLWSVDARNDYAGNLTDRMREHAENMLHPLDIDTEFNFSAVVQKQNIEPNTRQQLYLIFKEAINNIVKHSKASMVHVYYKQYGAYFELRVTNNNHSLFTENQGHAGQGVKNMKMRAGMIRAECIFNITEDEYTVIIKSY